MGGTGGSGGMGSCSMMPPTGVSTVEPPGAMGTVGQFIAALGDENDDPMVAYTWKSPQGSPIGSQLLFTRWDRCAGGFKAPVMVDFVNQANANVPNRGVAIAYDQPTKKIVLAYVRTLETNPNPVDAIFVSTSSDGGVTWSTPLQLSTPTSGSTGAQDSEAPAVGIHGSDVWVTYAQRNSGPMSAHYCGQLVAHSSDGGASFTTLPDLVSVGSTEIYCVNLTNGTISDLKTDSSGTGWLTFIGSDASGTPELLYGPAATPTAAIVVSQLANDGGVGDAVSLAFDGLKPRIAVTYGSMGSSVFFLASNDGITWPTGQHLPDQSGLIGGIFLSLALAPSGAAAVSTNVTSGTGMYPCGAPEIIRSTDLMTWTPCGVGTVGQYNTAGVQVQSYFTAASKLTVFMQGELTGQDVGGILMYRDP